MKVVFFMRLSTAIIILLSAVSCSPSSETEVSQSDTFFCANLNETYTIMAKHHWGNIPILRFQSLAHGPQWTPQRRCDEIAQRLDKFHRKGWLKHLSVDRIRVSKGIARLQVPVICISPKSGIHRSLPRKEVGLLMTLTEKDDGEAIVAMLQNISKEIAEDPIELAPVN